MSIQDIELPPYVDPEAWTGFLEMRKEKGKRTPFTDRAARMILKTLALLHENGHDCNAALDQSTLNGWSGVFEPRKQEITRIKRYERPAVLDEPKAVQTPEEKERVREMLARARSNIRRVA